MGVLRKGFVFMGIPPLKGADPKNGTEGEH
jgi:hypothetical protein